MRVALPLGSGLSPPCRADSVREGAHGLRLPLRGVGALGAWPHPAAFPLASVCWGSLLPTPPGWLSSLRGVGVLGAWCPTPPRSPGLVRWGSFASHPPGCFSALRGVGALGAWPHPAAFPRRACVREGWPLAAPAGCSPGYVTIISYHGGSGRGVKGLKG